jgi:hypothetical protein
MATADRVWRGAPARPLLPGWQVLAASHEIRSTLPQWGLRVTSAESGPARIEGWHAARDVLLVLDECRSIPDDVVDSTFQLLGGHEVAKVLMVSTPGGCRGRFYEAHTRHAARWLALSYSAESFPRLRAHAAEQIAEHGDSAFVERQVRGRFADDQEGDQVFPLAAVRAAALRAPILNGDFPPPGVLGFDPAGRGANKSIACFRAGPNVFSFHDVGGADEMETCGKLVSLADRLHVQRITTDTAGMGSVYESRLREIYSDPLRRRVDVSPWHASWKSGDERFANAKTRLCFALRKMFVDGRIKIPNSAELLAELTGFTLTRGSDGRAKVVDPSPSPDRSDSMLASFAADLYGPSIVGSRFNRGV